MTRKVVSFVHVVDRENDREGVFGPDDTVPAWAVKLIDNESVWAEPLVEKPAGNASIQAWQDYARSLGADVEGLSRNELREQFGN